MEARRAATALLAGLALALPGCGGDDEEEAPPGDRPTATAEGAPPPPTTGEGGGVKTEPGTDEPPKAQTAELRPPAEVAPPEDGPGGGGDEIPTSVNAHFVGRGGRITPRVIRVPPFTTVYAILRSADKREYMLEGGGKRFEVDAGDPVDVDNFGSLKHEGGLPPGRRIVLSGPQGRVVIDASAEPGP